MPILVLSLFRFVRLLLSGHVAAAMENAALRVSARCLPAKTEATHIDVLRPTILGGAVLLLDRLGAPLVYVQADTVVRWQRERFPRFRARRSRVNPRHRGRPATAVEIRRLIERMVADSSHYGLAGILSRRLANLLFDQGKPFPWATWPRVFGADDDHGGGGDIHQEPSACAPDRAAMMGVYFGGLIIAGALTFLPGRLMYRLFFG
jgi:hypothetical protein